MNQPLLICNPKYNESTDHPCSTVAFLPEEIYFSRHPDDAVIKWEKLEDI